MAMVITELIGPPAWAFSDEEAALSCNGLGTFTIQNQVVTRISGCGSAEIPKSVAPIGTTVFAGTTSLQPEILATSLEPTSLVVTSLDDTLDPGTLRWAITEANAQSGSIYDKITFTTDGTITPATAYPHVSQTVEIVGNNTTTIDAGSITLFTIDNSSVTLKISNLNFVNNSGRGTIRTKTGNVTVTNSTFSGGGTAIFIEHGNTLTVIDSTFTGLNVGIGSDHGEILLQYSTDDSVYANKAYISGSTFSNNVQGIRAERSVFVTSSTFASNGVAINARGINKHRVTNSTFSNNGTGIATFSSIRDDWVNDSASTSPESNNRIFSGNAFSGGNYALVLDDGVRNGPKTQENSSVFNNSWDEQGTWVRWSSTVNGVIVYTEETTLEEKQFPFYFSSNNTGTFLQPTAAEPVSSEPQPEEAAPVAPVSYGGPLPTNYSNNTPHTGEEVIITGRRLNLVASCSIDGVDVRITNQSPESITILIPSSIQSGLKDLVMIGPAGKLTAIGAFTVQEPREGVTTEALASTKVNSGSFNGYVAVYAKGLRGKTLSWKIADRWFKKTLTSDYQVFQRKSPSIGREVLVDIYVDGQRRLEKTVTSR